MLLTIPGWDSPVAADGNKAVLQHSRIAFFCSRRYPAKAVLPVYQWAKTARENGECIISGFHSPLEQDVLDILLRGKQPLIIAAARTIPHKYPPAIQNAITAGRLLVISPFADDKTKHTTPAAARRRNSLIATIAKHIVIGYASKTGTLARILSRQPKNTNITRLTEKRESTNR